MLSCDSDGGCIRPCDVQGGRERKQKGQMEAGAKTRVTFHAKEQHLDQ